jgi:sugar lactone lactonase YvrE
VSGPTLIAEDILLSSNGEDSLDNPWGLAFDGFGNLWVTNEEPEQNGGQGSIVEFTPNQLTSSGSPNPNAVITSTAVDDQPSIEDPNGDAIDIKGDFLFFANAGGSSISGYDLDGIATGSPVPNVFVFGDNTTLNAPAGLTIGKAF